MEQTPESRSKGKSDDCRFIINWDELNMWAYQIIWAQSLQETPLSPQQVKDIIDHITDEHAKAKVDRLVVCLFSLPWGVSPKGFKIFSRAPKRGCLTIFKESAPAMEGFDDEYDIGDVLLERAKPTDMEFIICLRMNDRHPGSVESPFFKEHPEWQLNWGKGKYQGGLDYKYEGVRDTVLAVAAEFLERYDADGIELDWMRWCHMFQQDEAQENTHLLTDFMVKMRKILDDAAKKRGRDKLVFGVRIPNTIYECKVLGFDIKGWCQQAGLDYMCPTDFHCMDYNIKIEEYVALAEGTGCEVFPSANTVLSLDSKIRGLSHANFRAAAKNFYDFGAQGVSTYNFYQQFKKIPGNEAWGGYGHAPADYLLAEWPKTLQYVTAIRNPKDVTCGNRHYLFHPIRPEDSDTSTGVPNSQIVKLLRDEDLAKGSMQLRVAEDFESGNISAMLEFKITGMVEDDHVEIKINEQSIPAEQIERIYQPDGQKDLSKGRLLDAFYLYRIAMSAPIAQFGDNELMLRLTKSSGKDNLIAQEFEVQVKDNQTH